MTSSDRQPDQITRVSFTRDCTSPSARPTMGADVLDSGLQSSIAKTIMNPWHTMTSPARLTSGGTMRAHDQPDFRIARLFVSAVAGEHRDVSTLKVMHSGHALRGMEQWGANATDTSSAMIQRVLETDTDGVIFILDSRYGSMVPGCDISFCEWEYELALQLHLPSVFLLLDERTLDEGRREFRLELKSRGLLGGPHGRDLQCEFDRCWKVN